MTTKPVMSITDEQLAELEESFAPFDGQQSMMIKGLITRLREAEADARRFAFSHSGDMRMVEVDRDALYLADPDIDWYRKAIDTAMEQTK